MDWFLRFWDLLLEHAAHFSWLKALLYIHIGFVVLGLLYWLFTARDENKVAFWRSFKFLFPRNLYAHHSVRIDLLIAPITIGATLLIQVLIPLLITIPSGASIYELLL